MDHVTEHVAAHPYYLQGVKDERERLLSDPDIYRLLRERWLVSKIMKPEPK
jgi:hypothetical protein